MSSKSIVRVIVLFSLFATLNIQAFSQPGDPPPPDDVVPITGIEILVAFGAALGGYSIFKGSKKQND